MQGRPKPRRAHRPLRGDGDAADPEPSKAIREREVRDADQQGSKDSFAPLLDDRGAVPDVSVAGARIDLELELPDPFRLRGQPAVPGDRSVHHRGEAANAASKPRSYQGCLTTHRGVKQRRAVPMNFLDRKERRTGGLIAQVRRPECAAR